MKANKQLLVQRMNNYHVVWYIKQNTSGKGKVIDPNGE